MRIPGVPQDGSSALWTCTEQRQARVHVLTPRVGLTDWRLRRVAGEAFVPRTPAALPSRPGRARAPGDFNEYPLPDATRGYLHLRYVTARGSRPAQPAKKGFLGSQTLPRYVSDDASCISRDASGSGAASLTLLTWGGTGGRCCGRG